MKNKIAKTALIIVVLVVTIVLGVNIVSNYVNIEELQKNKGIMFSAKMSNWGMVDDSDFWSNTIYEVYYDGTMKVIDHYAISGDYVTEVTLSDQDYKAIYQFARKSAKSGRYAKMEIEGSDGAGWFLYYYDQNGKETEIYSGYTYGIKSIEKIQDLLIAYTKPHSQR